MRERNLVARLDLNEESFPVERETRDLRHALSSNKAPLASLYMWWRVEIIVNHFVFSSNKFIIILITGLNQKDLFLKDLILIASTIFNLMEIREVALHLPHSLEVKGFVLEKHLLR